MGCRQEIHAGPTEATAIGNLTAQMLKAEEFSKTITNEMDFWMKGYSCKWDA